MKYRILNRRFLSDKRVNGLVVCRNTMNFTCPERTSFFWITGGRLDTPGDSMILV